LPVAANIMIVICVVVVGGSMLLYGKYYYDVFKAQGGLHLRGGKKA